MADSKISALTALATAPASGDLLVLVDISDTTMAASGTNKKITYANLTSALTSGATTFATSQAQTFTNAVGIGAAPTSGWMLDVIGGKTRLIQSGTAQTSGYALSVQSSASSTWLEILNSGGTGKGAFFGISSANFEMWNYQAGSIRFYTNTAESAGSLRLTIGNDGYITAQGVSSITGTQSVNNGELRLGATATFQGRISYEGAVGAVLYIDNTFNNANGDIVFRTRTAGTAIVTTLKGTGRLGLKGITSPTAWLHLPAATTSEASFCIPSGSAPTSPVAGDIWNDGALTFYMTDATTNAVVNRLNLRGASSGTPAAGFGVGVRVGLMSSTTANQDAGRLTWAWSTATHASRAAVGKLTAYYTSTERETITWIADSTEGKVGINGTPSTHALEITSAGTGAIKATSATTGTSLFSGGQAIDLHSSNYTGGMGFLHSSNTSSVIQAYKAASEDADLLLNPNGGNVGLGVVTPAGKLHGYDGSGGFLFVNRTGVDSTLVTVIPDGTGDVTERLHMFGWVSNSAGGFVSQVNEVYLDVSSSTTKTDGSNTLTIAVTAAGAFTLQTTLGSATWKVLLWVFWR